MAMFMRVCIFGPIIVALLERLFLSCVAAPPAQIFKYLNLAVPRHTGCWMPMELTVTASCLVPAHCTSVAFPEEVIYAIMQAAHRLSASAPSIPIPTLAALSINMSLSRKWVQVLLRSGV